MPLKRVQGLISHRMRERAFELADAPCPVVVSESSFQQGELQPLRTLRMLSFNIQVGITTQQYGHYLTRSWQHLLPAASRQKNLNRIAQLIRDYDLVGLQEVDGGSLRSGFVNQIEYLAEQGRFPWWYQQLNRNLGQFAQHSNGLLSRCPPHSIEDHKLPGLIPGRGAIVAEFGEENPLLVVILHLALSRRGREYQLQYIREVIDQYESVVLMGDMNAHTSELLHNSPLEGAGLHNASQDVVTFPSWKPKKSLDHIFLSASLRAIRAEVLPFPQSDHLPVAVEIELPSDIKIRRKTVPAIH